jgi:RNA polymerase sigma-70 factor (ECF subfamily)
VARSGLNAAAAAILLQDSVRDVRIVFGQPNCCAMPPEPRQPESFIPTRRSLLSRLRNLDDDTSWRDFFETYWRLIYSAAVKAGLSDVDAQDVVQETILTVSRKIQMFKYDPALGSFKGWLLHTTRWRILDHLRKREAKVQVVSLAENASVLDQVENTPEAASSRIDAVWEAEWQQNLLEAAIQRIKLQVRPKAFQTFELYALKGWSAAKVAETLGVNRAQVHLAKHRIGKLIRKEVERLQAMGV